MPIFGIYTNFLAVWGSLCHYSMTQQPEKEQLSQVFITNGS
jgi:hypothetical protein